MIKAGLIGSGIAGSLTPAMHVAEGAAQGLNYSYVRFDVSTPQCANQTLANILSMVEADGFAGVNITYPYKQAVLELLDEITDEAGEIGAVNTVVFRDGKRFGHNTDYNGFRTAFAHELSLLPHKNVALVGAGGAGAAVGLALLDEGVKSLCVLDNDLRAARRLVSTLQHLRPLVEVGVWSGQAAVDGLINATPMGMVSHPGAAVSLDEVTVQHWVGDIVYFPLITKLLHDATSLKLHTMTGGGMAVGQASDAFQLFTGLTASAERMTEKFLALNTDKAA
jgi:shikimate dehydrogenase